MNIVVTLPKVIASLITDYLLTSVYESYDEMGLHDDLLRAVYAYGFEKPSPVQQIVIKPLICGDRDLIVQSIAGTGKTASYLVAAFQRILTWKQQASASTSSLSLPATTTTATPKNPSTAAAAVASAPTSSSAMNASTNISESTPAGPTATTFSVVVLATTRELAWNIYGVVRSFIRRSPSSNGFSINANNSAMYDITARLIVGGTAVRDDIAAVSKQNIDILIGTPGRVADLIARKVLKLSGGRTRFLVLDEADELLSRGFRDQIIDIWMHITGGNNDAKANKPTSTPTATTPASTTSAATSSAAVPSPAAPSSVSSLCTCVFSSTIRTELMALINLVIPAERHPPRVWITPNVDNELTLEGVRQYYVNVEEEKWKFETLNDLLGSIPSAVSATVRMVIFTNTRRKAEWLTEQLRKANYSIVCLHGDQTAAEREATVQKLREGSAQYLVSTELLAHITFVDVWQSGGLSAVIHYDPPLRPESYIHRLGVTYASHRTRRSPMVVLLITKDDIPSFREIERFYNIQIDEMPLTAFDGL